MPKANFGEFAAFTTRNQIRYMKDNKMISKDKLPVEVVEYLNKQLAPHIVPDEEPVKKFAPPTAEEKERLKKESLEVPEHLRREEETAPEVDSGGFQGTPEPTQPVRPAELVEDEGVNADFLESVSIHTASISDIAQALYERFGLYTVYLGQFPQSDEINPLTGENFTKYHLGIAYQAAIRAQNQGILDRPAEEGRKALDQGRAASENIQGQFVPQAHTFGEARQQNSFDYRTSVRGMNEQVDGLNGADQRFDGDEDEMVVEPRFGKQVIRPDW